MSHWVNRKLQWISTISNLNSLTIIVSCIITHHLGHCTVVLFVALHTLFQIIKSSNLMVKSNGGAVRRATDTEERLCSGGGENAPSPVCFTHDVQNQHGLLVSRNLRVQCVAAVLIPNCKWVTLRFPSSMMNLASSVPHCASPASYRSYTVRLHTIILSGCKSGGQ